MDRGIFHWITPPRNVNLRLDPSCDHAHRWSSEESNNWSMERVTVVILSEQDLDKGLTGAG